MDTPQVIVLGAIGGGRVPQLQRFGDGDRHRRRRLAAPGQDVDDDVGGMDALAQRCRASRFDRLQAVAQHRSENGNHLPIAPGSARQLAAHLLQAGRQDPILERRTIAQRTGLRARTGT